MKAVIPFVFSLFVFAQLAVNSPAGSLAELTCGTMIMEDTTLEADLTCPAGTQFALIIGASDITLDLGGHTLWGTSPAIGVYADGVSGITINSATLGTIPTDGNGELLFLLDTGQASGGFYTVTASTASDSATAKFTLSSRHLNHEQQAAGTVFVVPSRIGLGVVYLPLVIR